MHRLNSLINVWFLSNFNIENHFNPQNSIIHNVKIYIVPTDVFSNPTCGLYFKWIYVNELEGLEFFYRETELEGEPDVIVLGDLNADCRYLGAGDSISFRNPEYIWVVDDTTDTTVSGTDCAYDRFIFKLATSEDFTGEWGVVKEIPDNVSDHYLVWAEFWIGKDSN